MVIGLPVRERQKLWNTVWAGTGDLEDAWGKHLGRSSFDASPYIDGQHYAAGLRSETYDTIRDRCKRLMAKRSKRSKRTSKRKA
jgi:hypothetical protein